jgi:2-oxoglutarate dehydrogenase complex dehydrogenase (E1) component-like enzyme
VWEAQFGDFSNGAQVVIDQFDTSSHDKWDQRSSLVLLLPHGYEGQGPEHSSARLERFLQLAARDNVRIVQPTTAAQVFHCLWAQARAEQPLLLFSPKGLLVHPATSSPLQDLAEGAFRPVLVDAAPASSTTRVVLCAGQLHQRLARARDERGLSGVSLLRLEQYYPFPVADLRAAIEPHGPEAKLVWAQEEPENMGAWRYLAPRLAEVFEGRPWSGVCRPESASPATGSRARHEREDQDLLARALG